MLGRQSYLQEQTPKLILVCEAKVRAQIHTTGTDKGRIELLDVVSGEEQHAALRGGNTVQRIL